MYKFTSHIIYYSTVVYARGLECMQTNAKLCRLYHVTRHVASTLGPLMTNGANYKNGKIHQSPWHSDIGTPSELNTPAG